MTILKLVNTFICQWFFFRIARIGNTINNTYIQTHWGILYPVIPLSGWGCSYIPNQPHCKYVCKYGGSK